MTESFKDYPKSIAEIQSDRNGDASAWSPRDVLISMLREIDNQDVAADSLVVCFREKSDGGGYKTGFRSSGPDIHTVLGLLRLVEHKLLS